MENLLAALTALKEQKKPHTEEVRKELIGLLADKYSIDSDLLLQYDHLIQAFKESKKHAQLVNNKYYTWTTEEKELFKFFFQHVRQQMKRTELFQQFTKLNDRTFGGNQLFFYNNQDFFGLTPKPKGKTKSAGRKGLSKQVSGPKNQPTASFNSPLRETDDRQGGSAATTDVLSSIQSILTHAQQIDGLDLRAFFEGLATLTKLAASPGISRLKEQEWQKSLEKKQQRIDELEEQLQQFDRQVAQFSKSDGVYQITQLTDFLGTLQKTSRHA